MIEQKFFTRKEIRPLKHVMAIVIHWPGDGLVTIDGLWKWMNEKSDKSYHFLVSKKRIIQVRDTRLRAIHCGHVKYKKKAKEFFGGNICSSANSPNNYTIGVCMLHDRKDGAYCTDTMQTSIELLSDLCAEYGLDPSTDILRHSDITPEKRMSCPKGFFEDDDDPDDLFRTFKSWVKEDLDSRYDNGGVA